MWPFGKKSTTAVSINPEIINILDAANEAKLKEICVNKDFFNDLNFRTKLSIRFHDLLKVIMPIHAKKLNGPDKMVVKAIVGISKIEEALEIYDALSKANAKPAEYVSSINQIIEYLGVLKRSLNLEFL